MRALGAIYVASAKLSADRTAARIFTFVGPDLPQTRTTDALGIKTRYIRS